MNIIRLGILNLLRSSHYYEGWDPRWNVCVTSHYSQNFRNTLPSSPPVAWLMVREDRPQVWSVMLEILSSSGLPTWVLGSRAGVQGGPMPSMSWACWGILINKMLHQPPTLAHLHWPPASLSAGDRLRKRKGNSGGSQPGKNCWYWDRTMMNQNSWQTNWKIINLIRVICLQVRHWSSSTCEYFNLAN